MEVTVATGSNALLSRRFIFNYHVLDFWLEGPSAVSD